jgi:uncharacterized lipoprotein YajG
MDRIRLPLAALALFLLAACQSAAPTAPVAPRQPSASIDSVLTAELTRGGGMIGSGT